MSSENDPLLLEYITASKRRGRAGSKKRRAMNHRADGGSEKKRAISEALRAENAELRAAGKRAYRALGSESPEPESESDPPSEVEYADIEKLTKKHKTHRSSLDQDYKFITSA